jgi:anti-sigma B factor antagonist/stage II sporulation protein AA (anti-sigma F factor antagonist)
MENFSLKIIEHIAVVKVELISATLRDSQALWDLMDVESIFEKKKIIIDLSSCNFIDSTFIGMIIKIYRQVSKNGGSMKIVFPQVTELESFRVIGITKIISCFPTISTAVESFNPDSTVRKISIEANNKLNRPVANKNN